MNLKEIILVFIAFFITVLVLSSPLWLEAAIPIIKDYLNLAIDTFEKWYAYLKFISGQVEGVFIAR
jgi:E3 ubiquitin-protein ligase DOA10